MLSKNEIREVFMAHGFTVKEGQTDLKQYVYDAAYALLERAQPAGEAEYIYEVRYVGDPRQKGAWFRGNQERAKMIYDLPSHILNNSANIIGDHYEARKLMVCVDAAPPAAANPTIHPDHLALLKPFMSERDGRLTHSLTVYLQEMADPDYRKRMHEARKRLHQAGIPEDYVLVRVREETFDALMRALDRAEDKGYLPDAIAEEWQAFDYVVLAAAPHPTD